MYAQARLGEHVHMEESECVDMGMRMHLGVTRAHVDGYTCGWAHVGVQWCDAARGS
jgi:hypothetical protein